MHLQLCMRFVGRLTAFAGLISMFLPAAAATGQTGQDASALQANPRSIEEVVVVGSRARMESRVDELPVAVDLFQGFDLERTGETDLGAIPSAAHRAAKDNRAAPTGSHTTIGRASNPAMPPGTSWCPTSSTSTNAIPTRCIRMASSPTSDRASRICRWLLAGVARWPTRAEVRFPRGVGVHWPHEKAVGLRRALAWRPWCGRLRPDLADAQPRWRWLAVGPG